MAIFKGAWKYNRECRVDEGGCGKWFRSESKTARVCPKCKKRNYKIGAMKSQIVYKYRHKNNIPQGVLMSYEDIIKIKKEKINGNGTRK